MANKKINAVLPYGSEQMAYSKTRTGSISKMFFFDVQAFFESEEGRKEYEEWQKSKADLKAQKADKTA